MPHCDTRNGQCPCTGDTIALALQAAVAELDRATIIDLNAALADLEQRAAPPGSSRPPARAPGSQTRRPYATRARAIASAAAVVLIFALPVIASIGGPEWLPAGQQAAFPPPADRAWNTPPGSLNGIFASWPKPNPGQTSRTRSVLPPERGFLPEISD
jgi:hypothetical protein